MFGGGDSIDKGSRKPYVSWWPQEIPTTNDFYRARATLEKSGHEVDYVLTHTVPEKVIDEMRKQGKLLFGNRKFEDPTVRMLDQLERLTSLDLETGAPRDQFCLGPFKFLVSNRVTDRLLLAAPEGTIISLGPRHSPEPKSWIATQPLPEPEPATDKPKTGRPAQPPRP